MKPRNGIVCIITTVHPPFDPRIFEKQARSLSNAGYAITLIAQYEHHETRDGIEILPLRTPRSRLSRMLFLGWRAFFLALGVRADVYHFHDPELMPFGLLLRWITRSAVIYDAHEDYPQHMLTKFWLPQWVRRTVSRMVLAMERRSARSLSCVISATPSITERFLSLGAHRAETILNLPTLDFLPPESSLGSQNEADVVHVGSLSPQRLKFLLEAAERMNEHRPGTTWKFIGIDNRLQDIGRAEAEKRGITSRINFIDRVSHEVVGAHLCSAKLGVNHHPAEDRFLVAIPVKVLEYMAAGLPVVSSDLPLLRELVGPGNGICLVPPMDLSAFVDAALGLLDHPERACELGRKGRETVENRLLWSQEEEKLLALYGELLQ